MQKLLITLLFISQVLLGQGKAYKAIDGITYKKGDLIKLGVASKGTDFQFIYTYKHVSGLTNGLRILDAVSGNDVNIDKDETPHLASSELNHYEGKILQFRKMTLEDKTEIVNAIVEYKNDYRIMVPVDLALFCGEMKSSNPDFSTTIASKMNEQQSDMTQVKSFSPDFEIAFISAKGDTYNQTVTISYTIKHKLVHQRLDIGSVRKDWSRAATPSKAYDFEGNEYDYNNITLGSEASDNGLKVTNKVPTNVTLKASVTFIKILPDVKSFNFVTIPVSYKDDAGGNPKYGEIEISNVKINWD
ncbi:conserved hypothetical protein [Capnocytophaga canimorsus]|nr:hypothetical protein [Capnocytophaga canimorsus]CEN47767.1 conserved hypothetical protein [Capnocytophaga canimorsus]